MAYFIHLSSDSSKYNVYTIHKMVWNSLSITDSFYIFTLFFSQCLLPFYIFLAIASSRCITLNCAVLFHWTQNAANDFDIGNEHKIKWDKTKNLDITTLQCKRKLFYKKKTYLTYNIVDWFEYDYIQWWHTTHKKGCIYNNVDYEHFHCISVYIIIYM